MVSSYSRGHRIYLSPVNDCWRYVDNEMEINDMRPCAKCGREPTPEGYDACLGYVEGATSACCGHGLKDEYQIMKE